MTDFKWIGSKVDCYNPALKKGWFDFYKSFYYKGETFNLGDFALITSPNSPKNARIGMLVCIYHSHEKWNQKAQFRGSVRWYTWAKDLDSKVITGRIRFDEKNEVIEDMRDTDIFISLEDIQKKCHVVFGTADDTHDTIKRNGLNPDVYFLCRYKMEYGQIVPYFSEKDRNNGVYKNFIVNDELCVKSENSEYTELLLDWKSDVDHSKSPLVKVTPVKATPTKITKYKRKPSHTGTPAIILDSEGSDVDVDKVKSPSNPLKNVKLTPKSRDRKVNEPISLKRNSSVKRVLNDSFESPLTSPSGIPVLSYSIYQSDIDDKNIKLKLKLVDNQNGINLKVFPVKLDEEVIQMKSPIKIHDIQQLRNHIELSPDKRRDVSRFNQMESTLQTPGRIDSLRRRSCQSRIAYFSPTPSRQSSRNVEKKSYTEFDSPDPNESTPKKRIRRASTDSSRSVNVRTPFKELVETKLLSRIAENEDENFKLEVNSNAYEKVETKLEEIKVETDDNEDNEEIKIKNSVGRPKKYSNNAENIENSPPKQTQDVNSLLKQNNNSKKHNEDLSKKQHEEESDNDDDDNNFNQKSPTRSVGRPKKHTATSNDSSTPRQKRNVGCPKRYVDDNQPISEKDEVTPTRSAGRPKKSAHDSNSKASLASDKSNLRPRRSVVPPKQYIERSSSKHVGSKKQTSVTSESHPKKYKDDSDDDSECTSSRSRRNVGRPKRYTKDSEGDTDDSRTPRLKSASHSKKVHDSDDNHQSSKLRSVGRPKKKVDDSDDDKSSRPKQSVGRPKKYVDDSDDNSDCISSKSRRNVGRPKRYTEDNEGDTDDSRTPRLKSASHSKKIHDSDDNHQSSNLRSVGRPKKKVDDSDDDNRSSRPKRSVGRPKKYQGDEDDYVSEPRSASRKKKISSDESDSESDHSEKSKKSQVKLTKRKTPTASSIKTPHARGHDLRRSVLQSASKKLNFADTDEDDLQPKTPKRGRSAATPKSISKNTPTARAKMIREGIITPSVQSRKSAVVKDNTPLSKARTKLHVSYVPKDLPCREKEFADIINFLEGKLLDGCGGCMYVSGVPGTGKTATVTEVIKILQESMENGDVPSFQYVNINGMRLSEPRQSYVEIVKQIMGKTVSWEQAQTMLENKFVKSQKKCKPIILVVDELDILCTKRQDVVYNLLDWPTKANAQLIVITIANTMDLPERLLMGRVTSRLGLTRLTFQAYTHKQLQEIVAKRLSGINAFNPDAIQLVARKVASVSGDARRALDICRRAAEIAELEGKNTLVSMIHVNQALNAMITQPKVQAIKHCSRLQKLVLQAVVAEVERTGVEETTFLSVLTMLVSLAALDGFQMVSNTIVMTAITKLGACRLLLIDQKCSNIYQRIILNVSADDVYYALTNTAI